VPKWLRGDGIMGKERGAIFVVARDEEKKCARDQKDSCGNSKIWRALLLEVAVGLGRRREF
jgi:hypothetical protein